MKPRFIAVEGPIGVGKTTLARRLADTLDAVYIADPDAENPYLDAFYRDPAATALHTQLHFLLSRLDSLDALSASDDDGRRRVSDFLIDKDRLFAELTLDAREWSMYDRLHTRLIDERQKDDESRPDLVIYLQAPLERLIERIERRGLARERRIDSSYLQALASVYERFFHGWKGSHLLIVNTADIDIAASSAETHRLVEHIDGFEGGKQYFNPGLPAD